MDVETALQAAISPIFPCAPNEYKGDALEYVVWNCYTVPQVYAEEKPAAARYPTQVHYFLPRALFDAGFSSPSITNPSDSEGQHYVLECEYVNAGGVYGES